MEGLDIGIIINEEFCLITNTSTHQHKRKLLHTKRINSFLFKYSSILMTRLLLNISGNFIPVWFNVLLQSSPHMVIKCFIKNTTSF